MSEYENSGTDGSERSDESAKVKSEVALATSAPPTDAVQMARAVEEVAAGHVEVSTPINGKATDQGCERFEVVVTFRSSGNCLSSAGQDIAGALSRELQERLRTTSARVHIDAISLKPSSAARDAPLFWKRWMVGLVGVYPLLIIIFYALQPLTQSLSTPASLFLVALVLTGLNTRYVAPFLARRLQFWTAR